MKQNPELAAIQANMQPGAFSAEGFLGSDPRNLVDILREDNQVVENLGVSHQQIAGRMQAMTLAGIPELGRSVEFAQGYCVTVDDHRGRMPCPFRDRHYAEKRNTTVQHQESGRTMTWTDLHIHMIAVHGFYEGRGSSFRLEPAELVSFLFPDNSPEGQKP